VFCVQGISPGRSGGRSREAPLRLRGCPACSGDSCVREGGGAFEPPMGDACGSRSSVRTRRETHARGAERLLPHQAPT